MKVAILAGGVGSRLSEETETKPKPMVEIGGRPILWHIMMHYASYGFKEFVIALGYKGASIKKYMMDYASLHSNLTIDMAEKSVTPHGGTVPDWRVDLVDTGGATVMKGGRIKQLQPYIGNETFMMTWGDGVSTIDLNALLDFHKSHGGLATVTAVRPPARFGHLRFNGEKVTEFNEKPQTAEGWINGAFFVLEPEVFDYIDGNVEWEREPLAKLARDGQLYAYKHEGFWQCMDTLRDKKRLEYLWDTNQAPWKIWE